MASKDTVTIRIDTKLYDLLCKTAKMYDMSPSALTVKIIIEGIRHLLTPQGINEWITQKKVQPVRESVKQLRKQFPTFAR